VIVYGTHPVEEALMAATTRIKRVVSSRWDAAELANIRRLCEENRIPTESVTREDMDVFAEGNNQGVAAELSSFPYADLERVLRDLGDRPHAVVLILDQVQDPQNLGAILRSAAGMGVDALVIPKDRAVEVTGTVIRASSGLAFRVPIVQVTNIARTLELLKTSQFWCVGTFMEDATPAWDLDFRMRTALVMGSEHKGIRPLVEKSCDFRVSIPMSEGAESLNVATATAILLYEIRRQCR